MSAVGFTERHARRGLVSNHDRTREGFGKGAPFASVICCGREECVEKAVRYVAGATNQTATYQPDWDGKTCWACVRMTPTRDVPSGDIPLCTKHWNWWLMRWLNSDDQPPCSAHLIEEES